MEDNTVLELRNISKLYPGVTALDNMSLCFREGEVHALVGENGAGKSTLIKIITGAVKSTSGQVYYLGGELNATDPSISLNMGIAAIYQEFNLIPYLSVAENVFYGREIKKGIFLDYREMEKRTKAIIDSMGISIDPKTLVKDLTVGYQQIVEIAKSISRDVKVLIMDEPSAPLTNKEIDCMFEIVRQLKKKGVTIIYISHRLEEVFELSDRVTVMRDGKYITTINTGDTCRKQLISLMVGRELGNDYPDYKTETKGVVLEVKGLNTKAVKDISFCVREGEILGFAGLVGAGRTEVARAIFGADRIDSGEIFVDGSRVTINSPKAAIKNGIGLIPEDRKRHGVLLELSVGHNVTYACLKGISRCGFIQRGKENSLIKLQKDSLKIKTPSPAQLVKNLSGGNQQKVVLAKWLLTDSKVLIFDEPTRGIDVGAKQEIYSIIKDLAAKGKAVIMISSEMPELLGMSDRLLIMHEGRIAGELNKSEATQESILNIASGG